MTLVISQWWLTNSASLPFTKAQYDEASRRIQLIEKNQDRIDEVWKFLNEGGFDPNAIAGLQEQLDQIKQDMIDGDQSVRDDLNNRIDALESELDQYSGKVDEAIKDLQEDKLNRTGPDTFTGTLTIKGGVLDVNGNTVAGIRDPDDGDERDAANKRYVDKMIANIDLSDQIDNFVKKDGDQVQGGYDFKSGSLIRVDGDQVFKKNAGDISGATALVPPRRWRSF